MLDCLKFAPQEDISLVFLSSPPASFTVRRLSCPGSLALTPIAVGTGVALFAGTLVLVGPRVDARPSVEARLVSATVVQVWGERERGEKKEECFKRLRTVFRQQRGPLLRATAG